MSVVSQNCTYFIRPAYPGDAPVKIGRTRGLVEARRAALQIAHPYPLTVLATDAYEQETSYHERFRAHRLSGEWFSWCFEIEDAISSLHARDARDPELIPVAMVRPRKVDEGFWVLDIQACPLCGGRHSHAAPDVKGAPRPGRKMGHRVAHCAHRFGGHFGYNLVIA